jgi:hypothetical protein
MSAISRSKTDDVERARPFDVAVLGWTFELWDLPISSSSERTPIRIAAQKGGDALRLTASACAGWNARSA